MSDKKYIICIDTAQDNDGFVMHHEKPWREITTDLSQALKLEFSEAENMIKTFPDWCFAHIYNLLDYQIQNIMTSNTQDKPYTSTLQMDDSSFPILVTPDSLYLYQTHETDASARLGRCSVTQFNKQGQIVEKKIKELSYVWIDDNNESHKSLMTISEKAQYELAEYLQDTSISEIYRLVKERLLFQNRQRQANYRNKKLKDENFRKKEQKRVAKSQTKIFINTMADLSELQELEKLIFKRKKQLD